MVVVAIRGLRARLPRPDYASCRTVIYWAIGVIGRDCATLAPVRLVAIFMITTPTELIQKLDALGDIR